MTTTTTTVTRPAVGTETPKRTATTQLWKTGLVSGATAAVATSAVAATARALDVSLNVGGEPIPVIGFAQFTLIGAVIGTVLAVVFTRWASRPRRTFVVTTLVLTALSIVPDALADAQTATRITLALTHVIAAAIVIPALASRLANK